MLQFPAIEKEPKVFARFRKYRLNQQLKKMNIQIQARESAARRRCHQLMSEHVSQIGKSYFTEPEIYDGDECHRHRTKMIAKLRIIIDEYHKIFEESYEARMHNIEMLEDLKVIAAYQNAKFPTSISTFAEACYDVLAGNNRTLLAMVCYELSADEAAEKVLASTHKALLAQYQPFK